MQQLELPLLPPRDQLYRALYGGSVPASAQNMVDRYNDHHGRPPLDPPLPIRDRIPSLAEAARGMFDGDFLRLFSEQAERMYREAMLYGRSYVHHFTPSPQPEPTITRRVRPDDTFEWSREMARYCRSDVEMRAMQSQAARARNQQTFLQGRRADYIIMDDLAFP